MIDSAEPLARQRDDGPLALVLRGRRRRMSATTATLLAVVPWFAVLAVIDDDSWQLPTALALGWLLGAGGLGGAQPPAGRLSWVIAPALHLAEYVGIARLAALSGASSLDTAYAFIAVVVLHHYDLIYRDGGRPQRVAGMLAGGWPGRLVVAYTVAAAGVARPAFAIAAGCAFGVFAGEAALTWKDQAQHDRMSVANLEEN